MKLRILALLMATLLLFTACSAGGSGGKTPSKKNNEPILLELPAGGESFELSPHTGEEFGIVLEGSVVLLCDGRRYPLRKGETFYLHGKTFHRLKNEKKTAARVLWVSTPPLF